MIINSSVDEVISNLKQGKVICFKTDTIWGFSADSNNIDAIQKLYKIKNRNLDKPFIFLVKKNEDLTKFVKEIPLQAKKLIDAFWCGPLTIIFEAVQNLPLLKPYRNNKTIALRMPNDALTQSILQKLPYPIVSTSVNLEGEEALNNFNDIAEKFKDEDFCLLRQNENKVTDNTGSNKDISSTIVSVVGNEIKILREGTITTSEILKVLNN